MDKNRVNRDRAGREKLSEREIRRRKALKKRKAAGKKSAGYRRLQLIYNMVFAFALIVIVLFAAMHVFTKKKTYRKEGLEYYKKGEYDAAIESFNKALKCKQWFSDSIDVDIEMYKADSYIKLADYADAERVYSSIKNKYPEKYYDKEKIDFLEELSSALDRYKYGDYVSTVACFNRAVEAGYTEMSIYAADCYEQCGDYEKMKEKLDIYTASLGYTPDICYKYLDYYMAMEDYNGALLVTDQGISCGDSKYIQDFMYLRIVCCYKTGEYDKAFQYASEYTATYPDDKKGADMYAWLDTRVNPDTEVINDVFEQNGKEEPSDDLTDENNSEN